MSASSVFWILEDSIHIFSAFLLHLKLIVVHGMESEDNGFKSTSKRKRCDREGGVSYTDDMKRKAAEGICAHLFEELSVPTMIDIIFVIEFKI